jgi:hypothetical protein
MDYAKERGSNPSEHEREIHPDELSTGAQGKDDTRLLPIHG